MAGNANSGRRQEKPFRDAIRMELASAGDNFQELREIARKLINKAIEGDLQAIGMLTDRTDGKPAQSMDIDANHTFEDLLARLK